MAISTCFRGGFRRAGLIPLAQPMQWMRLKRMVHGAVQRFQFAALVVVILGVAMAGIQYQADPMCHMMGGKSHECVL